MIRAPNLPSDTRSMHRHFLALALLAVALIPDRVVMAAQSQEVVATAADASATAIAPAAVAGVWALTVETSAGVGTPTVTIEQNGSALTGTYTGRFGDQPLTGTVRGDAIRFTVTITGPMGSAEVTYAGTVDGDRMEGAMQMGPGMDGRFTARRQL
jgi:hypothetical protein